MDKFLITSNRATIDINIETKEPYKAIVIKKKETQTSLRLNESQDIRQC